MDAAKVAVLVLLLAAGLFAAWHLGRWGVRALLPPSIPPDLGFRHELETDLRLREVAETLARRFAAPSSEGVVCLGPVRGNAARILFHSGPKNRGKNRNIHRADYILHVRRCSKRRVVLELGLHGSYSYLRAHRGELEPLVRALQAQYGHLTEL